MRTVQIDSDPDIEPEFGYSKAFVKPSDWVVTAGLCSDEYFRSPLTAYTDESGYWYSDTDPIYVRYVSDDSAYGSDMSLWPQTFYDYVAAHFAGKVVLKLTADKERQERILGSRPDGKDGLEARRLLSALNKNRMGSPTAFPPEGSWTRSRLGRGTRRDNGPRGDLIG